MLMTSSQNNTSDKINKLSSRYMEETPIVKELSSHSSISSSKSHNTNESIDAEAAQIVTKVNNLVLSEAQPSPFKSLML